MRQKMQDEAEPATTMTTTLSPIPLFPTSDYQYGSAHFEESQSDSRKHYNYKVPAPNSTSTLLSWRPFYLRRAVLFGFIIVFAFVIAIIESLLAISNKNSGIATSNATLHYLWTYGPTAFLTGVAAFWARTEYQSKLVAPWLKLQQNAIPTSHTLLLDYISPFSIFAIVGSWRNQDYIVLITLLVSMIIKILIIISSGLISLSFTSVTRDSYPMVLRDRFVDSNSRLTTIGTLASSIMRGIGPRNLTLPEGMSNDYAFQSVQTHLPNTTETRITVDGLTNSLSCEAANISVGEASQHSGTNVEGLGSLDLTISSSDCKVDIAHRFMATYYLENWKLFARFNQVQCEKVPGDAGKRILLLFGNISYNAGYTPATNFDSGISDYSTTAVLEKSTQLLCVPNYVIERVEVTRNGTRTNAVVPIQGTAYRILSSVTAWDIMDAHFEATGPQVIGIGDMLPNKPPMVPIETDQNMELVFNWQPTPLLPASLFDPNILQETVEGYYRQVCAIIAKQSLMEPASVDTIGTATINENRLIVHSWIAQWMVGLATACIFLTSIAISIVPRHAFLPRNPSSILDSALILQNSKKLMAQLQRAGASDDEHLVRFLKQSVYQSEVTCNSASDQFGYQVVGASNNTIEEPKPLPQISSKNLHPPILHPASRLTLCLGVVGLLATLQLLLQRSNLQDGLGNVGSSTYIHYAWTAIPALLFGALSMAFSAVDFEIRNLAPYVMMKNFISKDKFLQLEFLDMTIPGAIYREIKLRTPWALATTTAYLLASLFTIFSASLFQECSLPYTTSIILETNQSLLVTSDNIHISSAYQAASLIFQSNYSFPRFTYQNLAFPELTPIPAMPFLSILDESTVSISALIPAVRGYMDCRSYNSTQIYANLTSNSTEERIGETNSLTVIVDGEVCYSDMNIKINTNADATYIGETVSAYGPRSCSDLLYVWGKIDYGANPALQHIAALGCNLSFQSIDVDTTFIDIDLDMDLEKPPRPLESTVRNLTINDWESVDLLAYAELVHVDVTPQLLDKLFASLVTSPWAIPMSSLGDPSANTNVSAAIKFHYGILLSQQLAALLVPANEANTTLAEPIFPGNNDARRTFNATIVDFTSRRRVVQDPASTHILMALLATALVLFVLGWAFGPNTSVLPRKPTTIASVVALLAGGNLFAHLPSDGLWLSPEEIAAMLGDSDARFWMGWGNIPDEEGMLTGGENEAGVSQFGIFVVGKEEATEA